MGAWRTGDRGLSTWSHSPFQTTRLDQLMISFCKFKHNRSVREARNCQGDDARDSERFHPVATPRDPSRANNHSTNRSPTSSRRATTWQLEGVLKREAVLFCTALLLIKYGPTSARLTRFLSLVATWIRGGCIRTPNSVTTAKTKIRHGSGLEREMMCQGWKRNMPRPGGCSLSTRSLDEWTTGT